MIYLVARDAYDSVFIECGDIDAERLRSIFADGDFCGVICSVAEVFDQSRIYPICGCSTALIGRSLKMLVAVMNDDNAVDYHVAARVILRDWSSFLGVMDHIEMELRDQIMVRGKLIDQLIDGPIAPRHTLFGVDGARRAVVAIREACAYIERYDAAPWRHRADD